MRRTRYTDASTVKQRQKVSRSDPGRRIYMKKIGIVMGSDSDLPIIEKAVNVLKELKIPYEVHIYSAHRTPEEARDFAVNARANGIGVIIAAAGMAAHLAGAMAANTTLPVIGIPCKGPVFDGMDALLSTVQMPTGIPVATVAVGAGGNAALLAAQILAVTDTEIEAKLRAKREADAAKVLEKDKNVMDKLS
jgi:5-(carboxyamino)imidazole ribonucleotide mutase